MNKIGHCVLWNCKFGPYLGGSLELVGEVIVIRTRHGSNCLTLNKRATPVEKSTLERKRMINLLT